MKSEILKVISFTFFKKLLLGGLCSKAEALQQTKLKRNQFEEEKQEHRTGMVLTL